MKKAILTVSLLFSTSILSAAEAPQVQSPYYGAGLCNRPEFQCIKVGSRQSWESLFPNEEQRDLVQRLNRFDTELYSGKTLVVPKHFGNLTLFDVSPFPRNIHKTNEKIIIVDQNLLAWGAYNANGELVKWGPLSSGRDYCADVHRNCRSITGVYYVFNKKDKKCKSNIFPVGKGGSIMPYCMFFYKGFALHGSNEVHGFRDSHGCIRLFTRDALWLNTNFVKAANQDGFLGTKVVIQKIKDEQ